MHYICKVIDWGNSSQNRSFLFYYWVFIARHTGMMICTALFVNRVSEMVLKESETYLLF